MCNEVSHHGVEHTWGDWPEPSSRALVVYFAGCDHGCAGCHNPQLVNRDGGTKIALNGLLDKILAEAKSWRTDKVVFSGGDPLFQPESIKWLLEELVKLSYRVTIYTGFGIDEVKRLGISGFSYVKVNKYERDCSQTVARDNKKFVLASTNQEIYSHDFKLLTTNGTLIF